MRLQGRGIRSLTVSANSHSGSRKSLLLASPEYEGVTESWFSPEFWGARAKPVSTGGRGGAWFIEAEASDMVLRHYRRGGLAGRFVNRTYLYLGLYRSRSFAEYQLTHELYQAGLPVPRVVASIIWRHAVLWYRAAIIVERIPNAVNWPDSVDIAKGALWTRVGQMIRRFHDWGLDHVDLNCDNILVAREKTYLIDFDRCRKCSGDSSEAWKAGNLQRLRRSVDKRLGSLADVEIERLWQCLLSGYSGEPS